MKPCLFKTVVIADDSDLVRFSLKTTINAIADFSVLFEAKNGMELIDKLKCAVQLPDIVLMDIKMPCMDGYAAIKELKHRWPGVKIVVLSQYCEEYSIAYMIKNGACAFLSKKNTLSIIEIVLQNVVENGYSYSDVLPRGKFEKMRELKRGYLLSQQQQKLFDFICSGSSNKEIANAMNLSLGCVESYRKEINKKLGLTLRAEFLHFAIKNEFAISSMDKPSS